MSKKSNTVWFLLGATVLNIIVTIVAFIGLVFIYGRFVVPHLSKESAPWGVPLIFLLAIVAAFVVYRAAVRILMKRIDVDKHFDPLFSPRRKPPRN